MKLKYSLCGTGKCNIILERFIYQSDSFPACCSIEVKNTPQGLRSKSKSSCNKSHKKFP